MQLTGSLLAWELKLNEMESLTVLLDCGFLYAKTGLAKINQSVKSSIEMHFELLANERPFFCFKCL